MKYWGCGIIFLIVLAVLAGGGYWWYERIRPNEENNSAESESGEAEITSVASVKTVPIHQGTIESMITAYGTVVPAPGAVQTISVSFECKIRHVLVSEGQIVSPKDALVEIEPSPESSLAMEQARNSYLIAQQGLEQIQKQFELKFASNEQLLQAKQTFQDTKLRMESLQRRGIDGKRKLFAGFQGLITKVNVQNGALVSAGNSLVELVAPDQVEVKLGFELEEIRQLRLNESIALRQVNAPGNESITGRIRTISQAINSSTRLVDVFVALPPKTKMFLEGFVQGSVKITSASGWIVPRTAVLPEEDHYVLYTVKKDHAVKQTIQIEMENDQEAVVLNKDLHAGDPVVILGNYELEDGMAVTEGTNP